MSAVRLLAVTAENTPGQTAYVTQILANANLNIRWATIASAGDRSIMKFLVPDCDLAYEAFKHEGLAASLIEVLAVEVPDQPGALQAVAGCLARNSISFDAISVFVADHRAILLIESQELSQAKVIIEKHGVRVLTPQEMLKL